jgi:nucleotide-binding universal stress UspA family protein
MDILLPVDGRPHSQRSIELALQILELKNAFVTLLYAVQDAPPDMLLRDRSGLLEERYIKAEEDSALVLLKNLVPTIQKAGPNVQTLMEHGKPIPVIKSMAEKLNDPVIIVAPGNHSAKEKLLDTSVTRSLMNQSISQTLIAARAVNSKRQAPYVVFLADGSDECISAARTIVPLLRPDTNIMIVASHKGYWSTERPAGFGHPVNDGRYLSAQVSLGSVAEAIREAGRKYEQLIIDDTFDDWLQATMKDRNIALVVFTRTRADIIHRPIGGAHVESLFLDVPFSAALHCSQV